MAEELGKIEKPPVERFRRGRKLFFVPLVFAPQEPESELKERLDRYWDQVEDQLAGLELKLGGITKVYHELVPAGGEEGCHAIEELNSASHRIVRARLDRGADILPIEDMEVLTEFIDWSRCLAMGLQNPKVLSRVYESYSEAQAKRNKGVSDKIDESLKEDEVGILLMREGHQVQFPADIEVFYVAPPGLEEIKRWIRDLEATLRTQAGEEPRAEEDVPAAKAGDEP